MCTRKTLIKISVLHCFRSLKCTFSPWDKKTAYIYRTQRVNVWKWTFKVILLTAPLCWQRKKMKHSLNLLLLLNSTLFCIVRRNHSISGEDGKHGNHDTASAVLNIIFFLTISPLSLMEGLKEKPVCFSEEGLRTWNVILLVGAYCSR